MPQTQGVATPGGGLSMQVVRGGQVTDETVTLPPRTPPPPVRLVGEEELAALEWPTATDDRMRLDLRAVRHFGLPGSKLPDDVNEWRYRNVRNLWRGVRRAAAARALGIPTMFGALWVAKWDGDLEELQPLGLASLRVITDTGVAFVVDAFQNTTELENLKFHGMGTGGTAEAASQTALVTELTTEYNPNSTRATGTTTETSANIYRTVGTNTIDSGTPAITEHGIFSQAATGGGTMWDRSLFSAINLVGANADGIQFTYDATFTSGG